MNKWLARIEEPLKSAGTLVEKKTFRDFAHKFGLVYFGNISAQNDEYELVRGVTLHTTHQDRHFIIGNYKGYDVTVLQRHVELSHPHHGSNNYKWSIVQTDLQQRRLPHILITSQRHDRIFFDNLQIKLANFQQLHPDLIPDPAFARHFTVFSVSDGLDAIPTILTPQIMAAMTKHFREFDVELFDDQVVVYTSQPRATFTLLQELLRESLWLATHFDAQSEQGVELLPEAQKTTS